MLYKTTAEGEGEKNPEVSFKRRKKKKQGFLLYTYKEGSLNSRWNRTTGLILRVKGDGDGDWMRMVLGR
jgi:hypothetical protein